MGIDYLEVERFLPTTGCTPERTTRYLVSFSIVLLILLDPNGHFYVGGVLQWYTYLLIV